MDRKKIITAAGTTAAVFAILAAGGTSPSDAVSVTWGAARHAALLTAGIKLPDNTTAFPARNPIFSEEEQPLTEESPPECTEAAELQLTPRGGRADSGANRANSGIAPADRCYIGSAVRAVCTGDNPEHCGVRRRS